MDENNSNWQELLNIISSIDKVISQSTRADDPLLQSILIKNLALYLSGNSVQSLTNLTNRLYLKNINELFLNLYITLLRDHCGKKDQIPSDTSRLIFGLGTGRSGSTSLYELLRNQNNTFATHEHPPLLCWDGDFSTVNFQIQRMKVLLSNFRFVADVSHWWLNYFNVIIKNHPNSRFVCIKRNKGSTVSSFLNMKGNGAPGSLNHWMNHKGDHWRLNPWDKCYPDFETNSLKDAIGQYWDLYYDQSNKIAMKHPQHFKVFELDKLSSEQGQLEILDFCGFLEPVTFSNLRKNVNTISDGEVGWKDYYKLA